MEKTYLNGKITVRKGDITREQVDAIVNAANVSLLGGGGVDGAIHRAGGSAILTACKKIREKRFPEGLPRGMAVVTPAGKLHSKYVLHTVGPVWHDGNEDEAETLAQCYRNSLDLALDLNCKYIAFPAISTGVYGYPEDKAAKVVCQTLAHYEHLDNIQILLVFYTSTAARLFMKVADREWK